MRRETERLFDGKLGRKYLYQKLSKSDNCFSSYSRKCRGCFFWDTVYVSCVVIFSNAKLYPDTTANYTDVDDVVPSACQWQACRVVTDQLRLVELSVFVETDRPMTDQVVNPSKATAELV